MTDTVNPMSIPCALKFSWLSGPDRLHLSGPTLEAFAVIRLLTLRFQDGRACRASHTLHH